jgi:hypothetical protein
MNTHITNHIKSRVVPSGATSSFISGAALCYSIQTEKYSHIPFTIFCPVMYSGYHLFKNKEVIIPYFLTQIPQLKKYNTP